MSETRLIIGVDGFSLPRTAVTGRNAIVGTSGSGKTQTARKITEAMLDDKQHVGILDPTGAYWGLRSSADGLKAGYGIVVFGGEHNDAPLTPDAGEVMARAFLHERFNAIFDLSHFSDADMRVFAAGYLGYINLHNRRPVHVVMDEFDIFAPQKPPKGSDICLAVVNSTVRRGRIKGIGTTMVTQNPQDADKSVLNMAEIVIAMRTQGSQPADRIRDWMGRSLNKEQLAELMRSLPGLPTGMGWVRSAQDNIYERVMFKLCHTFDSSKTPTLGEMIDPPKVLAPVDIAKLGKSITAQVKEAQENNPEHLRKRIAELEQKLQEVPTGGNAEMESQLKDLMAAAEEQSRELESLRAQVNQQPMIAAEIYAFADNLRVLAERLAGVPSTSPTIRTFETRVPASTPDLSSGPVLIQTKEISISEGLNASKQAIVNAMATLYASPLAAHVTLELIACTAGTTPRARGFEENMRQLKKDGYVDGIRLTEKGKLVAKPSATPTTFRAALDRLSHILSIPQMQILHHLKITRCTPEKLADVMDTTVRARGFEENIRVLKKREYIVFTGGHYELIGWLGALPG